MCPGSTVVKGVDVSIYQGTVDWPKVKASGIDFAFARISDGTGSDDGSFAANWKGMKAAGIVRGSYQFFRASQDPTAQANLVAQKLQAAGGMLADDLPVVCDIEVTDGQSVSTIQAHMQTWLVAVQKATGKKPMIYTSVGTYPITSPVFSSYVLWVANYGVTCPSMPLGWNAWDFWQYADNGTVAGIGGNVDLDEFDGSLADLKSFAGAGSPDAGSSDAGPPPKPDGGSGDGGVDASAPDDGGSQGGIGNDAGSSASAGSLCP